MWNDLYVLGAVRHCAKGLICIISFILYKTLVNYVVALGWLGRLGGDNDLGPRTQEWMKKILATSETVPKKMMTFLLSCIF